MSALIHRIGGAPKLTPSVRRALITFLLAVCSSSLWGCGSTLPEGRAVWTTPAPPSEAALQAARAEQSPQGLVVPARLRTTGSHLAVLDVLIVPFAKQTAKQVPYHISRELAPDVAWTSLAWRYGGEGRAIDIIFAEQPVELRPAFYEDWSAADLGSIRVIGMRPQPAEILDDVLGRVLCVPIVIKLDELAPQHGHARVRIRPISEGLTGLRPYRGWVMVPIVAFEK